MTRTIREINIDGWRTKAIRNSDFIQDVEQIEIRGRKIKHVMIDEKTGYLFYNQESASKLKNNGAIRINYSINSTFGEGGNEIMLLTSHTYNPTLFADGLDIAKDLAIAIKQIVQVKGVSAITDIDWLNMALKDEFSNSLLRIQNDRQGRLFVGGPAAEQS